MEFSQIIKLLRITGPNLNLLSKLTGYEKWHLKKYLHRIPNLQFTPITGISNLRISVNGVMRRSLKDNKGISIEKGFYVKKIKNYSGIPEAYDYYTDSWDLSANNKGDYVEIFVDEFPKEVEIFSPLKSLTLKEPLLSMVRLSIIKGFVVDYGKRDFFIDILTIDKDIVDAFEYIPFIRLGFDLETEEKLPLYLLELYVPEEHFKMILKLAKEVCIPNLCQTLVSVNSYFYSKKAI